jgi:hypothetical protein
MQDARRMIADCSSITRSDVKEISDLTAKHVWTLGQSCLGIADSVIYQQKEPEKSIAIVSCQALNKRLVLVEVGMFELVRNARQKHESIFTTSVANDIVRSLTNCYKVIALNPALLPVSSAKTQD